MEKPTTITFTGDLSFDDYTKDFYLDEELLDRNIKDFLNSTDYTIINFESPITTLKKTSKESLFHKCAPESLNYIKSNFKKPYLSLANNHMLDYETAGLEETLEILQKENIPYLGAGHNIEEASNPIILGDKIKVGIISFQYENSIKATDTTGTFCERQVKEIKKRIKQLKKQVNYIVVIYHGGYEFINTPLRFTRRQLKKYLRMGADVVVAHHPHMVQGYETKKKKYIFYSLGNFIFDTDFQRAQIGTDEGVLLKLKFYEDGIVFDDCNIRLNRTSQKIETTPKSNYFTKYTNKLYNELLKSEILRINDIKKRKKMLARANRQKRLRTSTELSQMKELTLVDFNKLFSDNYESEFKPVQFKTKRVYFKRLKKLIRKIKKTNRVKLKKKYSIMIEKLSSKDAIKASKYYNKLQSAKNKLFRNTEKKKKSKTIFDAMPLVSIKEICDTAGIQVPNKYLPIMNLTMYNGAERKVLKLSEKDKKYQKKFKFEVKKFVSKYSSQIIFEQSDEHLLRLLFDWLYHFGPQGFNYNDYFEYELYNKTDEEASTFLNSEYRNLVKNECNKDMESRHYFKNKAAFNTIFEKWVKRDWVDTTTCTFEEFTKFVEKYPIHFGKPVEGTGGTGAGVFDSTGKNLEKLFLKYKKDTLIIEDIVKQHKDLARFNESTLNTLRVYTLLCADGKARVLLANARFGRVGNAVDNFHSGGVTAEVDVDTGIISSDAINILQTRCDKHPDSNIKFKGYKIPCWDKIVKATTDAATLLPGIRHIGWDVAVTDKGEIEFVEGNFWPNFDVTQAPSQTGKKHKYEKYIDEIVELNKIEKLKEKK